MATLLALLRATHPLPAAAVTTLIGVVAAARGAGGATLALMVASTAAGQASVGWSNDYLDRDRDRAAGRTEKPVAMGEIGARGVAVAATVAMVLSVGLSLPLGTSETTVMAAAVLSAWAYNLGLKATPASALPYALSFGLAPIYIWVAVSDRAPASWLVAVAALLGVAAHLINVLPDLAADRRAGVRGLPHRLGDRGSLILACLVLGVILATVLLADGARVGAAQGVSAAVAALLIAAVAAAGLRGRGRLGFRLTILAAGAIVATFLLSPAAARL